MVSRPLPCPWILDPWILSSGDTAAQRPQTQNMRPGRWHLILAECCFQLASPLRWGRASPECLGPACAGTCGMLKWVSRVSARWVRHFTAPKFGAGCSSLGRKGNPAWNRVYSCRTNCELFQGDVNLPLSSWLVVSKNSATREVVGWTFTDSGS